MHLVPVRLSLYEPDDCTIKNQQDLLDIRIIRISNEAHNQGAQLTQVDIAILLEKAQKPLQDT